MHAPSSPVITRQSAPTKEGLRNPTSTGGIPLPCCTNKGCHWCRDSDSECDSGAMELAGHECDDPDAGMFMKWKCHKECQLCQLKRKRRSSTSSITAAVEAADTAEQEGAMLDQIGLHTALGLREVCEVPLSEDEMGFGLS